MRKTLTLKHIVTAETYNVNSIDEMNKDVAAMLEVAGTLNEDNMVCVVIRQKAPDGSYRISSVATSDIDVEEIRIGNGSIDKLTFQGRE